MRCGGVLLAVVFLVGCGGPRFDPSIYPTPDSLLAAAKAKFDEGDCGAAEIGFVAITQELTSRDPLQPEARFYLAECMFKQKHYLEATRAYRRLADEFSQHPLAPRALLRAGDAFSRLWKRPELDGTYGLSALNAYQELLARYPGGEAATDARERIARLNEWFAKKEFRTGEFYRRLKAYDSAIQSYRNVVTNWPETSYAPLSLLKLVEAYDKIGYEEDRRDMCSQLRRFYPEQLLLATACLADSTAA